MRNGTCAASCLHSRAKLNCIAAQHSSTHHQPLTATSTPRLPILHCTPQCHRLYDTQSHFRCAVPIGCSIPLSRIIEYIACIFLLTACCTITSEAVSTGLHTTPVLSTERVLSCLLYAFAPQSATRADAQDMTWHHRQYNAMPCYATRFHLSTTNLTLHRP